MSICIQCSSWIGQVKLPYTTVPRHNLSVLKKIQGLRTVRGKGTIDLGDSRRGVEVQSEELSLQAAAEDGQEGSSSYGEAQEKLFLLRRYLPRPMCAWLISATFGQVAKIAHCL